MTRLGTKEHVEKALQEWEILHATIEKTKETVKVFYGGEEVFWALKKGSSPIWICHYSDKVYADNARFDKLGELK